jgi:3-hydroxybutyryl-CoA dehydrogenase
VTLDGRSAASLERGLKTYQDGLAVLRQYEIVTPEEARQVEASMSGTTDLEAAARQAEWVIESIAEDLSVKHELFARLDALCPPQALLTSNTSGLRATDIATATRRPTQVLTTHFWNPPHLMELVEVVPGEINEPAVAQRVVDELNRWGNKHAVLVRKDILGQLGNRMQHALLREVIYLLQEGVADAETLDIVLKKSFGLRSPVIGQLESNDLVGLQTVLAIQRYLNPVLFNGPGAPPLLERLVAEGHTGAAAGQGLRDWRQRDPNELRQQRQTYLLEWFANQRRRQRAAGEAND